MGSSRRSAAAIFLVSGTASWFLLLQYNISDSFAYFPSNPFLTYVNPLLFYLFACISAIGWSFIKGNVVNRKFFGSWIALGTLSTALLPFFPQTGFMPLLSILLGLSLGLGLPGSMAFLADSTFVEERARVSGTTISISFGMTIIVLIMTKILGLQLSTIILLIALVRSTSFIALVLDKFDVKSRVEEEPLYKPDYKDLFSYLIPWSMFLVVSILAWNFFHQDIFTSAVTIGQLLRFSCIAIFGFAAGFSADRFGRKPSIIFGLVVLGIDFAILGFAISELSVILYLTVSGITWGFFMTSYLAIPGDLSIYGSREKFYAVIVVLPLMLLGGVPYLPGLADVTRYSSWFSQVLSLILFLAIIPIYRAQETLSESKMRESRLKEYVDKVGKLVSESKKKE